MAYIVCPVLTWRQCVFWGGGAASPRPRGPAHPEYDKYMKIIFKYYENINVNEIGRIFVVLPL